MNAITIKHLKKSYQKNTVLHDINLEIEEGEIFFLLGESGCGKSTLLRAIAGLEKLDEGEIYFGEKNVTKLPTHKREAAMVFQSYALWPHMTVGENIAFGLEERGVRGNELVERILEALKNVRLERMEDRRIDSLSGGQQQRVALARALIVRPQCLLLDEPLSNLDAKLRLEMRSEIRRIVKQHELTAVYVTHDQEEALSIADRIAVMHAGNIMQVGTPDEIYRLPQSEEVAQFIGTTNLIEAEVTAIISDADDNYIVQTVCEEGCVFEGRATCAISKPKLADKVKVSIRPEALNFSPKIPSDNQMEGTVIEHLYQGSSILYTVRRKNREFLQVAEMNPLEILPNGETVTLTAKANDIIILS